MANVGAIQPTRTPARVHYHLHEGCNELSTANYCIATEELGNGSTSSEDNSCSGPILIPDCGHHPRGRSANLRLGLTLAALFEQLVVNTRTWRIDGV